MSSFQLIFVCKVILGEQGRHSWCAQGPVLAFILRNDPLANLRELCIFPVLFLAKDHLDMYNLTLRPYKADDSQTTCEKSMCVCPIRSTRGRP